MDMDMDMDMIKDDKAVTFETQGDGARTTVAYNVGPLKGWTIEVTHEDASVIRRGLLRISPKDVKVCARYAGFSDVELEFRWNWLGKFTVYDARGLDALDGLPIDWKAVRDAAKDGLFEHLSMLAWEELERSGGVIDLYDSTGPEIATSEGLAELIIEEKKRFQELYEDDPDQAEKSYADDVLLDPDFDPSSRYYVWPTAPSDWGEFYGFDGPRDFKEFMDMSDRHKKVWWVEVEDDEEEDEGEGEE